MKLTANFNEGADVVDGIGKQLPFAVARTLTKVAQDGQAVTRQEERSVFTLRNDWTTRNTKITPATKQSQMAEVYTDTSNRKTGAPDYLQGQEDGKTRYPFGGRSWIAVPTKYLRKIAPGVIPKWMRPKDLLPKDMRLGETFSGRFGNVGKAAARFPRTQRQQAALSQGNYVAFVQRTKGGTLCIFVRHGGMRYSGSQDAEPWYTLVTSAKIPKRLHMLEDVQKAVDANLQRRWDESLQEIAPLKI